MSLRYNIEMAFFWFAVMLFQYFISNFNTDMHLIDNDIRHLEYFHIIEILPDGHIITIEELRERNLEYQEQHRNRLLAENGSSHDH